MLPSVSIGEVLKLATQQLSALNIASARLDARLLLAHVMDIDLSQLIIFPEKVLTTEQYNQLQALIQRRLAFEPVSRIIGKREFWGLDFTISPATLDPRSDSETLIETVLSHIDDRALPLDILDLGTGSGCLLLSLLHELPAAQGMGIDISADAIHMAQRNAGHLVLTSRATFKHQNWCTLLSGQYDWVISNPPYISRADIATLAPDVRLYDPSNALDGGNDGLECYRMLATIIKALLKPNGKVALEVGHDQAPAVEAMFCQHGFLHKTWGCDLSGIARCGIFTDI